MLRSALYILNASKEGNDTNQDRLILFLATKLLHRRHGRTCAGVCAFLWVLPALKRCLEHQCMRRCVRCNRCG